MVDVNPHYLIMDNIISILFCFGGFFLPYIFKAIFKMPLCIKQDLTVYEQ